MQEINMALAIASQKIPNIEQTKFGYAINRFTELNLKKPFGKYNAELEKVHFSNALTGENNRLLYDERSERKYAYSKDGLAKVIEAEDKLKEEWSEKIFEIESYICSEVPDIILKNLWLVEVLDGLLLNKPSVLTVVG